MPAKKSSIDVKLIRELAEMLNDTDLTEIEVEEEDLRIRLSRETSTASFVHSAPMQMAATPAPVQAPAAPAASAEKPASEEPKANGDPVTSPMVGTAYHSPAPNAPPFVTVGANVTKGETIMIVEAMKTMNQIPATKSGTVTSIAVDDGQPVEFGQTLITIQ